MLYMGGSSGKEWEYRLDKEVMFTSSSDRVIFRAFTTTAAPVALLLCLWQLFSMFSHYHSPSSVFSPPNYKKKGVED